MKNKYRMIIRNKMNLRRSSRLAKKSNKNDKHIDIIDNIEEDIYSESELSDNSSSSSLDSFIVDDKEIIYIDNDDNDELSSIGDDEEYKEEEKVQKIDKKIKEDYIKFLSLDIPHEIKDIYMKKMEQLQEMSPSNGEYFKLKRWVEGFTTIPFGQYQKLPFEHMDFEEKTKFIQSIKEKLDNVIYGHQNTKDEIVCMMVKWMMNPGANGNILALHGQKGSGKTELIKNGLGPILGRPVHHISLGGLSDGTYLDGHEFTYEGSMWGRIVDVLMKSKCMNPIFFFDELDKVSETRSGREIIGKLIHLTDHTQNNTFMDKYFQGIPIDISKAIFIFSFNDIEYVDKILLDRIKVIKMDTFNLSDKINIARDFLLPRIFDENKLFNISFSDECITNIITKYCSNGGVRDIKRHLEEIVMKINVLRFIPNKEYNIPFDKSFIINTDIIDKMIKPSHENISITHMYI